ncbi:MAG: methyltransferase [Acidobacteria bacterium]|nr:methyltransferase [Acidobacteriota bacterium]
MTLTPPSPAAAQKLRDLFARAHFDRQTISKVMGRDPAASFRKQNLPLLQGRAEQATTLNTLLRWLLLAMPVDSATVRATIEPEELEILLETGLVRQADEGYRSDLLVTIFEDFYAVSDHLRELESGTNPDAVLMVNRTTWRLGQYLLREPVEDALELGTGCGAVALLAARYCRHVVATDLNPRAIEFARFNAALNGVENIEWLVGDVWQPVEGRKFDRIFTNPPFFISPGNDMMFCENPYELDGFCRMLVREAGDYLRDGGFYQMVFEWAGLEGQTWKDRLEEWFDGIGCDAWAGKGYTVEADRYSLQRISETVEGSAALEHRFPEWSKYFAGLGVREIHGGVMTLRKRSGENWTHLREIPEGFDNAGEPLRNRFNSLDYAYGTDDETLLDSKPKLADSIELRQQLKLEDGQWKLTVVQLELRDGIPDRLPTDPSVLPMLAALDGRRTLREIAAAVAQQAGQDPERTAAECAAMVRALAVRGFVSGAA